MAEEKKDDVLVFKQNIGDQEIYIEYIIKNDEALMERSYFPPEYIKAYIFLLNKSILDLEQKNIKKLVQRITVEDWDTNIKFIDIWKQKKYLYNEQEDTVVIYCDIQNAMNAILKAFGFEI
jgi:hypothetical protein